MINFIGPNAVNEIEIDGQKFQFRSINVRTKLDILSTLGSLDQGDITKTLDDIKTTFSRVIVSVENTDGNQVDFDDVFETIADFNSIKELMNAVIKYCSPKKAQVKNSDSSLDQPSPVLAGSAENNAEPGGEPAGIILE